MNDINIKVGFYHNMIHKAINILIQFYFCKYLKIFIIAYCLFIARDPFKSIES